MGSRGGVDSWAWVDSWLVHCRTLDLEEPLLKGCTALCTATRETPGLLLTGLPVNSADQLPCWSPVRAVTALRPNVSAHVCVCLIGRSAVVVSHCQEASIACGVAASTLLLLLAQRRCCRGTGRSLAGSSTALWVEAAATTEWWSPLICVPTCACVCVL